MAHDSRRYHRTRRPTFARAYGVLGALGGAAESAGSALGSAASAVGSGLESAASSALGGAGSSALGGLSSIGQGLQSLFSSGGGEAGHLAALGQAVPAGVELAGPSSTFTGPGFLGSVMQGFTQGPAQFANPSAGTSLGAGVGQLLSTLDQLNAGRSGGMSMQPIIGGITGQMQGPRVIPGGAAQPGTGPIMKLLGIL
jgi:hypothetical protein